MGRTKKAEKRENDKEEEPVKAKRAKTGTEKGGGGKASKKADPEASPVPASTIRLTRALDIISEDLMGEASRDSLREQYREAQPYTHCVMRDVFKPQLLAQVREEIINNIQATYKETDLFKVFQTGDLGNLDKLDKDAAAKLPTLMSLKDALYSPEFRAFIRQVTGCGELADKTDCSCNVYATGGHLLCHDDVIGTRRVSWIIYLTDPDEPWTQQDGGALELYPLEQERHHTPQVHPSLNHLPTFNTMAMFTVLPGKSFHAVQEVLAEDKPRMSISGWYHAPCEPEDMKHASLQQLQAAAKADEDAGGLAAGQDNVGADQFQPFVTQGEAEPADAPAADAAPGLTEDDLAFLIRYVNPTYLSEASWPKIQSKFAEDGSIQLQQFLSKSLAAKILTATKAADEVEQLGHSKLPEYKAGVHGGWEPVGPPHKQRYLHYPATHTAGAGVDSAAAKACHTAGALLAQVRDVLFRSASFKRLLACFTTLNMVGQRGEARRFRPGLDYTVAHYGILTQDPRLDVVLCFVDTESGQEQEPAGKQAAGSSKAKAAPTLSVWDDGEVGGFEAYLLADEDKEGAAAAEVYRQDAEDSGVLNVSAAANSLNLVLRDEGLMKFVKYVSAAAPGSRWDVAMEYLPEDDDSDDEQEEEEEEEKGRKGKQQGKQQQGKQGKGKSKEGSEGEEEEAPKKAKGKAKETAGKSKGKKGK